MTEPATVYITNMASDHDYRTAAAYGTIRPVTSGNYPIFKSARLLEEVATTLSQSSEEDYLLFSGSSFVAGIRQDFWIQKHKERQALLFGRQQRRIVRA